MSYTPDRDDWPENPPPPRWEYPVAAAIVAALWIVAIVLFLTGGNP